MKLVLKQERQNKKWTLSYVASEVGVTPSTIHDMESGRCKPSYDVLVKLLELFDYNDPRQLFAVADEKNLSDKE